MVSEKVVPFPAPLAPFHSVYSLLHLSMSSPYSSRYRRTMFSTKLERLLPLSPSLRTMKSARSCAPPAQIDRLSVTQLGRHKIGLLVGFECLLSHFGTDTPLNGCTLSVRCRFRVRGILCALFDCWSFCFGNHSLFL